MQRDAGALGTTPGHCVADVILLIYKLNTLRCDRERSDHQSIVIHIVGPGKAALLPVVFPRIKLSNAMGASPIVPSPEGRREGKPKDD